MNEPKLPRDFLLGTATAAVQIEGGDRNNSWYRWCELGKIKDGAHCVDAVDHRNRVAGDIALMTELGCRTYRMGIEWSRLEPAPGKFDEGAVAYYRDELTRLLSAGIRPLVTLHHFSNPLWFEDSGSWLSPGAPDAFLRYAEFAVRSFGDLVSDWITINEPNVYLAFGFLKGLWPPGKSDLVSYFKGAARMVRAHRLVYPRIHQIRRDLGRDDTLVGVAHHLRVFDPATKSLPDKAVAALYRRAFQDMFVESMTTGRSPAPLPLGSRPGKYADFLGINYYTRDMMRFAWDPAAGFGVQEVAPGAPVNDLGWEIYPEGLGRLCRDYYRRYGLPIFITENGIADGTDSLRRDFIRDHLLQVSGLLEEGVDIRRYYHWSLMDNFEWLEGRSAKFGLAEVDYETMERRLRPGGRYFASLSG